MPASAVAARNRLTPAQSPDGPHVAVDRSQRLEQLRWTLNQEIASRGYSVRAAVLQGRISELTGQDDVAIDYEPMRQDETMTTTWRQDEKVEGEVRPNDIAPPAYEQL
jgi:hypothetical protein